MFLRIVKRRWYVLLVAMVLGCVVGWDQHYNRTFRWFNEDLPSVAEVMGWDEAKREGTLFRLSRWDGFESGGQFREFVERQILPLGLNRTQPLRFLEIGMGVGAFSRVILQEFPYSTGVGLDVAPSAIEIAKAVLPADRMTCTVGDMRQLVGAGGSQFDAVFVPGALCLLFSMADVRSSVGEFHRVLRPGGGLCISLVPPENAKSIGACKLRIAKQFWEQELVYQYGLTDVSVEDMDGWQLPHSLGRYHVCMRKAAV